jgi:hypothetical protein
MFGFIMGNLIIVFGISIIITALIYPSIFGFLNVFLWTRISGQIAQGIRNSLSKEEYEKVKINYNHRITPPKVLMSWREFSGPDRLMR